MWCEQNQCKFTWPNIIYTMKIHVDAGEPFVKSTYILEGDGLLVFKCYDQIQILKAGSENAHYPNVNALAHRLSTRGHTPLSSGNSMQANVCNQVSITSGRFITAQGHT